MTTDTIIRSAGDSPSAFGSMLREWRRARGSSQLDLSLTCGLSQRHLSFLESGRSRPSRQTILQIASALDVPLRQQNAMLLAAGFAPVYQERPLHSPDLKAVDDALTQLLARQQPYPAIVVDQGHNILRANEALGSLLSFLTGADLSMLFAGGAVNAIEIALSPDGLRPVIENWDEVAAWSVRRLRTEAMTEGLAGEAARLLRRVLALPDVSRAAQGAHPDQELPPTLAIRFRRNGTRLALFSILATVGTPLDVSVQNLRLELFFPADAATAAWFDETRTTAAR